MTPVSLKSTSRPIIIAAQLPLPEVNDVVLHGGPILVQDDVAVAAVEEHLPLHHSLHLPHEVPFLLSIAGPLLSSTSAFRQSFVLVHRKGRQVFYFHQPEIFNFPNCFPSNSILNVNF